MKKNLNEIIDLETSCKQSDSRTKCLEKIEVKINSCLGFIFLFFTGYWFNYIYNYFKEKKYKSI